MKVSQIKTGLQELKRNFQNILDNVYVIDTAITGLESSKKNLMSGKEKPMHLVRDLNFGDTGFTLNNRCASYRQRSSEVRISGLTSTVKHFGRKKRICL